MIQDKHYRRDASTESYEYSDSSISIFICH